MINPNINKYILVDVLPKEPNTSIQKAVYRGAQIEIHDMADKKPGRRRMYLRYSIVNDCYYLKSK